jgi:hypothetical protein
MQRLRDEKRLALRVREKDAALRRFSPAALSLRLVTGSSVVSSATRRRHRHVQQVWRPHMSNGQVRILGVGR